MANGCSIYVIVPKQYDTVLLCLYPMILKQALIRPEQRRTTVNDILAKLADMHYITLIDVCYHNVKCDKSYLP